MDQYQDYKLLPWELMGFHSADVCMSQSCTAGEDFFFFGKSLLDKVEKGGIPDTAFSYCSLRKVCSDLLSSGKMDSALRSS